MAAELKLAAKLDLDSNVHSDAEYRRSASPQANKTGAGRVVADFLFPGIMGFPNAEQGRRK
jgi:hypothetical protein